MKPFRRLIVGLIAALLVAAFATAPAQAGDGKPAPAGPDRIATYQTFVEVTTYDDAGNVIDESRMVGPVVPIDKSTQGSPTTIRVEGRKGIQRTLFDSGTGGNFSVKGCRTVHVANVAYTVIGQVAYKFHAEANYCWNLNQLRTTYNWSNTWVSNVQGVFQYRGLVNNFHNPIANGHRVFKQGKFDNCVPMGCFYTTYPSVDLKLYNNGYWGWVTN